MFNFFKRKKVDSANVIFQKLKANKHMSTEESLTEYYNNAAMIAESFIQAKQIDSLEKLTYLMSCVEREKQILKLGVNQYIFRDDIEDFLDRRDIKASNIKLIELSDYPRVIPAEIRKKIKETEKIFDKMYVLFTDYSGTIAKKKMREDRIKKIDKDPILFGTFQEVVNNGVGFQRMTSRKLNDKFYVIGDWVDEYCDLTLDKLVAMTSPNIVKKVEPPKSLDEIKKELEMIKKENTNA